MSRIVWKLGSSGGKCVRALGPSFWGGGTCEHKGQILIYDELPGEIKTEGGRIIWQGQDFCDESDVVAIIGS